MLPKLPEEHVVARRAEQAGQKQAPARLFLIEDDFRLCELLQIHLHRAGYSVDVAHDGATGLTKALQGSYALVLLDLMLPRLDGFAVCRRLRAEKPLLPVLILTARSREEDKVRGLDLGADDYLTKPFSLPELTARIRALLRRARGTPAAPAPPASSAIRCRDLVVDPKKRKATLAGERLGLTTTEFDLLAELAAHPGRAFTRAELLERVWGPDYTGYGATVNTHINRLRKKVEADPSRPYYIQTVWGVGYCFADFDEPAL